MMKRFLHKLGSAIATVSVPKAFVPTAFVIVNACVSCIEPPLKLPAEEVLIDVPLVLVDIDVVWSLDIEWQTQWLYDWDVDDVASWGEINYPEPVSYEVRRYFLGDTPGVPHTTVDPPFTVRGNSFRRTYEFGYYDMLLWSNVNDTVGSQYLKVDDSEIDEVHATTGYTHGLAKVSTRSESDYFNVLTGGVDDGTTVTALYNQPEIFYATYPRDVYISRFMEDYDYYDEETQCWVKKLDCLLTPRVYIYLVQVILKNNRSGRIKPTTIGNALSNMSIGTSVNDGHTWNMPGFVYFESRMKSGIEYEGETVDVIGGKFTTFGLCDMPSYESGHGPQYEGSRTDLANNLYVDFTFNNGGHQTIEVDVTDQVRRQAHGGVITVVIDAHDIPDPPPAESGGGSLFVPTVEDYEEVVYDIVM